MARVSSECRDRSVPWSALPRAGFGQHLQTAIGFLGLSGGAAGRQHEMHSQVDIAIPAGAHAIESGAHADSQGVTAAVHGLYDDSQKVSQKELTKRIEQIRHRRLLPDAAYSALHKLLDKPCQRMWRIEQAVEDLLKAVPNIPTEMLVEICEVICPELYGEPPAPPRASHALPKSRARLAALQRRHQALHSLWHRDDSFVDGIGGRQQELFLYAEILQSSIVPIGD